MNNGDEGATILIGVEHSYYTGKVREYLDWKGIPYEKVVGSLEIYRKFILPNIRLGSHPNSYNARQNNHSRLRSDN